MNEQNISYTELALIAKEMKNLSIEIKNEINNINTVVSILENNPGIKSSLLNVSLSENVQKITNTAINYNNVIAKFANFLNDEVIKGTKKMQEDIRISAKKWVASIEQTKEEKNEGI